MGQCVSKMKSYLESNVDKSASLLAYMKKIRLFKPSKYKQIDIIISQINRLIKRPHCTTWIPAVLLQVDLVFDISLSSRCHHCCDKKAADVMQASSYHLKYNMESCGCRSCPG